LYNSFAFDLEILKAVPKSCKRFLVCFGRR